MDKQPNKVVMAYLLRSLPDNVEMNVSYENCGRLDGVHPRKIRLIAYFANKTPRFLTVYFPSSVYGKPFVEYGGTQWDGEKWTDENVTQTDSIDADVAVAYVKNFFKEAKE